jgi:hypothetical protein
VSAELAGGGDVVELLARSGRRLGDVDDLLNLGTAEAGDLHGTHDAEAHDGEARAPLDGALNWSTSTAAEARILLPVWAARGTLVP